MLVKDFRNLIFLCGVKYNPTFFQEAFFFQFSKKSCYFFQSFFIY